MFHVPEQYRVVHPLSGLRHDGAGNNGFFAVDYKRKVGPPVKLAMMASDGHGWEHVSVSIFGNDRCPKWEEMCAVKDLFWDDEDTVVQFHPPKSEYVNFHGGTLHLWRPTDGKILRPNPLMIGPK